MKYFLGKFETVFEFYLSLGNFFYDKGYLNRSISSVEYYKVFIEFNSEFLKLDNTILKEIVKFDYLKFNKKKWMPDFLLRDFSKSLERELKDSQKKGDIKIPFKDYHLENFKLNIFKYLENQEIIEENVYLIFDENDTENILDITYFIVK